MKVYGRLWEQGALLDILPQLLWEQLSLQIQKMDSEDFVSCIREYRKQLQTLDGDVNIAEIKSLTDEVIHFKQKRYGELQEEQAQLKLQLNQNHTEREKISKKINKLKQ